LPRGRRGLSAAARRLARSLAAPLWACRHHLWRALAPAHSVPFWSPGSALTGPSRGVPARLLRVLPPVPGLSQHTREDLDAVAAELNSRPRKTLGWETPAERLSKLLAA
jgi:IS30 family transposase